MGDGDELTIELPENEQDQEVQELKKKKLKYDENEPNLVPIFMKSKNGRQWLKKIAKRVREDFDEDFESTEEYRKRKAEDFKIFAGDLPPKNFPFKDSANAHVPYMLENISRLQFRASAELFGDWSQPFGVVRVGNGPEEDEIVDILTIHGNWQIREQMPDFRRQVGDRGLLLYFCAGDVTCHSYYDVARRRNVHEVLTCDEFVVPYVYVSTQPDYSDVPHRTKILRRYRHELQQMRGRWHDVDRVINRKPPGWDDDPEQPLHQAVAEVHGLEIPTQQKGAPYKLLEYEGWLPMPPSIQDTESDAEDRDRFVKVVMDHESRHILELSIFEEPPWNEKERFERQTVELEQYRQQLAAFEEASVMAQNAMVETQQQAAMGLIDPMQAQAMIAQTEQQMQMLQPPPIPEWLEGESVETATVAPMRKEPIHMYTHIVCIEPLVGNLGLSYGRIQADYNRAADTTLSQFIDSATLANAWSIITDNLVQFEKGAEFGPGKINKATGFSGKIADHIYEMRPSPGNPQLFDFVRFMNEIAQSSIQAPNVLSGEPGKSGETYRGIATRIEQATKQLTYATQKYGDGVRHIMKNNARLNAAFLPEEEMRYLMDHKAGQLKHVKIERRLYERNYDVTFTSDLRYAPQAQRVAEADEVTQMALSTPILQQNLAFSYEAIVKSLEARDRHELVPLLGPPPPPPPMFGLPSLPPMPGMPMPGQPPQGQQGGENPADGAGMQPPSPGVASGPGQGGPPQPPPSNAPGPGGPVQPA